MNPSDQPADASALHKAHTMLSMLPPGKRTDVLSRMDPARAEQLRAMGFPDETANGASSPASVAQQRQLMEDFQRRVSEHRIAGVDRQNVATPQDLPLRAASELATVVPVPTTPTPIPTSLAAAPPIPAAPIDPLDELRHVHPVALARTMQGERAETWAIVLDRIDHSARAVIMGYLDGAARTAIESAMRQRELLSPLARDLAEHAIRTTVVPRALREHHILTIGSPAPSALAVPATPSAS